MSKLPYEVARDRQWDLVDVVAVEHAVARTDRTLRQVLQPQVGARTKHKQSDADPLKLQNHKTKSPPILNSAWTVQIIHMMPSPHHECHHRAYLESISERCTQHVANST